MVNVARVVDDAFAGALLVTIGRDGTPFPALPLAEQAASVTIVRTAEARCTLVDKRSRAATADCASRITARP